MTSVSNTQLKALLARFDQVSIPAQEIAIARQISKIVKSGAPLASEAPAHRIAIIGNETLTELADLLSAKLMANGVSIDLYIGDFNAIHNEILQPESGLYQFKPTLVLILCNYRSLPLAQLAERIKSPAELVTQEIATWEMLWGILAERTSATIIQNNFDRPSTRIFGNLESRLPITTGAFIDEINTSLNAAMPDHVILHDLAYLASYYGLKAWNDPRFYYHSKHPCSLELLPAYAQSLANLIEVTLGKLRKCLVLDLDNTLWGGVIGDDGLDGIEIGQGSPIGEAHLALQRYALALKQRGVLLAVCSKNSEETAVLPFKHHPDMLLKLDDIACFVANWDPKPNNLEYISQTLNIGLDSLVFVDDNPAERAIVRDFLPTVAVPEMPEDPAYYVQVVEEGRYFEVVTFAAEDTNRTEMYKANAARKDALMSATDMTSFLASLDMKAVISPFVAADLERIAQLVGRSNQFNVTTKRHTKAELQQFMESEAHITFSMRLKDRFGDNGLIAVWIGTCDTARKTVTIDTWLMSCRVLSRGSEQHLRNHVAAHCKSLGFQTLVGVYSPTAKNMLVAELYPKLGFAALEIQDQTDRMWALDLDNYTAIETQISTVASNDYK